MMFKRVFTFLFVVFTSASIFCQVYNGDAYRKTIRPTKNVIVMIPDGTSIGVVSSARWYQIYKNPEAQHLAIDPYICGTVKTFSSNAPIGDSAPTTSAYMTGMYGQSGNVSIYPPADKENDLVQVDPEMAYQPLATILEAMRMEQQKATGLVFTCEFPHATPADCSAHHYKRGRYDVIASQMAYQNLDVVFGGGVDFVSDDMKQHFQRKQISYYANDITSFRKHTAGKVWSLWGEKDMPYDIDRDTASVPALSEMTTKAINLLAKNENGFFLMVEGSKVDWAAHANDAVACITDFLAFDKAVQAAIEFAKKDGNTTVIVLPDHGNSGFTLGRYDLKGYDKASLEKLFGKVAHYKRTSQGLKDVLMKEKPENFKRVIKEYTGIEVTDSVLNSLFKMDKGTPEDYMKVTNSRNIVSGLVKIMNQPTYFGFTSGGHTGEEVFLAAYHPNGDLPIGMNTNRDINHYLADAAGLKKRLPELTKEIFAKHTDVFQNLTYEIDKSDINFPILIVKDRKNTLKIPAYKSIAYINNKQIDLGSVTVYIDKTDMFYLPASLRKLL